MAINFGAFRRCCCTLTVSTGKLSRSVVHRILASRRALHTSRRHGSKAAPSIQASSYKDVLIPGNIPLVHHVLENFTKYGELVAMVDGVSGKSYTYSETLTHVSRVGSALAKMGIGYGDIATMFSPNCPEFAMMFLGLSSTGATVSAVNPLYTPGELTNAVVASGSKLIITVPALVETAKAAAAQAGCVKEVIVFGSADGCRPFANLLEDDGTAFVENLKIDPKDDLAALPFSSGTTGLPKGVMLTHHNIISNLQQIDTPEGVGGLPGDQTYLAVLPFFHIYGQVVILLTGLRQGTKVVTLPRFEPESYLQCIQDNKVNLLHVAPPLIVFMTKHPLVAKYDLSSVCDVVCGAAPLGDNISDEFLEKVKVQNLRQGYGLTETSPVTHLNPRGAWQHGKVGKLVRNTQAKIVNTETGDLQGAGENGELCVRGPQVMKGYWQNQQATADTIDQEGWFHTGDVGHYDEDGYFAIVDRVKELIKYKGLQVAPAELENLLLEHPAVSDAAVIGVPDEVAGELPRAYVVLKPNMKASEQDVAAFVAENVANYKQLRGGVEFRTEIPKSQSGKILRRELKADYVDQQ